MAKAYVALGSNLGDRRAHLDHALEALSEVGDLVGGSPIYETEPLGGPEDQGPYFNAVVCIDTNLDAKATLDAILTIEQQRGRTRREQWGPRTLDCDLLWFDDQTIDEDGLKVPHPEIRSRPFVLVPLGDLEPGLSDEDGPFLAALADCDESGLRRISGPVDVADVRWMTGLVDATRLSGDGPYSVTVDADWSNSNVDSFGAYLAALALRAGGRSLHEGHVSQLSYRFLRPVAEGSDLTIDVTEDRRSRSSVDLTVTSSARGTVVGVATMTLVGRSKKPVTGPPAPAVVPRWEGVPEDRLALKAGRQAGASIRSWTPVARWDMPDLVDGTEPVMRAWCPNVTVGSDDPLLIAASIFMPIDALIWPATLQAYGYLPDNAPLITPTIEIAARFGDIVDEPWYLAEASIDHLAGKTVAGTVRVWGASGTYAAVGHSLNLVMPGELPAATP